MEFQDIAKATVENFNRYAEGHVTEGRALAIESESRESARTPHRLHLPAFHGRNTHSVAR